MSASLATMDNADLEAVLRSDDAIASAFLRLLPHPADLVEALRALQVREWPRVLRLVPNDAERAEAVALLDEGERLERISLLGPGELAAVLRQLDSDDVVDVLADLTPSEQETALAGLPDAERAQVEQLLTYAPDTAGGLMQVERAQVRRGATIDEAIARVRELVEDDIMVHAVYVVDDTERLLGQVPLAKLLLNRKERPMVELLEQPPARVTPDVDQERVALLFRKYGLASMPVVDTDGRMLGRILFDDVVDVLAEEHDEDALHQAGTSSEELLYREHVLPIARVRMPWLVINLFGSLISATLLRVFEHVTLQAIIISAFIPVITAMGGNVGTQSSTILTRGLATGRVHMSDIPRVLFREFRVGLLMGVLCGSSVGLIGAIFFSDGHFFLGIVVFLAMAVAMTVAASVGTLAPAAMKKLGIDPAIASGPFVTTANDIIGIIIYMSTALYFVDRLK